MEDVHCVFVVLPLRSCLSMPGMCGCAYTTWKMRKICFSSAVIQRQLGYARLVSLRLHCVREHVEQAFIRLFLGHLWLQGTILVLL